MRSIAVIAALAGALLAGCSSPSNDSPTDTGPTFDDLGLQATSTTGVIRGVVVDDAIRPLEGARVELKGPTAAEPVTTTALGTFGFDDLAPGTYFLAVAKLGYFDAQQSADVVAGVAEPAAVKVQLALDAENRPYFEEYVFEGFIECSTTTGAPGVAVLAFAACSAPNDPVCGDPFPPETCTGNVTQDNFGVYYQLTKKPTWMQSEMVWQSTQALGGKMSVQFSWDCGDENGGFLCDHAAAGTSPVLVTADAAAIEEINEGDYSQPIFVRAFNEGLDETQGGLGATVEQSFTVYTHVFYGYEPPAGWRFSSGEPAPRPDA